MTTLAELLLLRHEYEQIAENLKLPSTNSDIESLKWFLEHGHQKNRFKENYQRAVDIAKEIIDNL